MLYRVNSYLLFTSALLTVLAFTFCKGQSSKPSANTSSVKTKKPGPVGGGCDGCELMFIGIPQQINSIDTSPGWKEKGQPLVIKGKAFTRDGITPAAGIIIYYWQTDHKGYYSPAPGLDERVKRHGHIRGWVKTDSAGRYTLLTIRPAPYPGEDMPAHIHLSVKEPEIDNEYYIDELVFDDDPLLTRDKRSKLENRGGSGILKIIKENDIQLAKHTFTAGLNIPNYPE